MSEPTPPQPQDARPPVAPPTYVPPAYPPAAQTPPYAAPGAYQPPAYSGAPNPYAYGGYAAQKTNTLSIVAMIASIAGFIWILPFVGSLAGAIMGHISLNQIKQTGEKGRGMALAGVIVGWAGLAIIVLGALAFFAFIAVAGSATTGYSS